MARVRVQAAGAPAREVRRAAEASRAAGDGRVGGDGPWSCSIEGGATLADLLDALGLDPERPVLTLIGERRVGARERDAVALADGDTVSLMPAIRAG